MTRFAAKKRFHELPVEAQGSRSSLVGQPVNIVACGRCLAFEYDEKAGRLFRLATRTHLFPDAPLHSPHRTAGGHCPGQHDPGASGFLSEDILSDHPVVHSRNQTLLRRRRRHHSLPAAGCSTTVSHSSNDGGAVPCISSGSQPKLPLEGAEMILLLTEIPSNEKRSLKGCCARADPCGRPS